MYQERNEASKAGLDPKLICQVDSGLVFLSNMQFLRGYCILQADPVVESINYLSPRQRSDFLCDMALVGDAIMEVTGAYRINYALMGNSEPVLHAHIVPRYLNEPEELRKGLPWSYPNTYDNTAVFNLKRDQALIEQLCISIKRRLKESAE
jgi:diadenosine tetraphosphate (Ap4A) HIT family hydrolase